MKKIFHLAIAALAFWGSAAKAASLPGGRGGPTLVLHTGSLSNFDPELSGAPVIVGGVGFGFAAKSFRVGGGGGGGFLWGPSENAVFGLGYGGAVGEYSIAHWLNARLMIGGGGFSVGKITAETDVTKTVQKVSTGGFLLFYPSVIAEIEFKGWMSLGFEVGYFLPNVSKLQSFTMGLNLLFGKI